jgi:hypothetical protein
VNGESSIICTEVGMAMLVSGEQHKSADPPQPRPSLRDESFERIAKFEATEPSLAHSPPVPNRSSSQHWNSELLVQLELPWMNSAQGQIP